MGLLWKHLRARWFLLSLVVLIGTGLAIGSSIDSARVASFERAVPSSFMTACILFLMAFTLDSSQLRKAYRSPAPVILACCVNSGLLPLLGWGAMQFQPSPDLATGLMIAASVPSTLAAASVWTRKAGGNDAISLLTTVVTNTLCFITTPLWLQLGTARSVPLDSVALACQLLAFALVPTVLGQLVRISGQAARFAGRHKVLLGVVAQSGILTLVFVSACKAGRELQRSSVGTQLAGFVIVWATCVALHCIGLFVGHWGGRKLGFNLGDRIASAFAGSQKTLPIGVYLATSPAFVAVPFAVFPMLMFHASQLFVDTLVADRFATLHEQQPSHNRVAET